MNPEVDEEIKVPDIGAYKALPVIEVLVKVGDTVEKEQSLVTLESDKATMDVPSTAAGTIKEVKVKVGDNVSEGSLILVLESAEGGVAATALGVTNQAAKPSPDQISIVAKENQQQIRDELHKLNSPYESRVRSDGCVFSLRMSTCASAHELLERLAAIPAVKTTLSWPMLRDLPGDDEIGLLGLYTSGELCGVGRVVEFDREGVTMIIEDSLDLIDPSEKQPEKPEIKAFESEVLVFAVEV